MEEAVENESLQCHNYSDHDFKVISATKFAVSSTAVILCTLAIVIIGLRENGRHRFSYRLVLYFMITVLCQAVVLILEQIPVTHNGGFVLVREGWEEACSAFGFLDQVTLWMGNFVVLWIFLYLLHKVWKLYKSNLNLTDTSSLVQPFTTMELLGILVIFFLPWVFNWIPFMLEMYGLSGLWCWIKAMKNSCNEEKTKGLVLMFVMFYGPLLLFMLLGIVSILIMMILLCRRYISTHGVVRKELSSLLKEMALVVLYPVLYDMICILLVVNRFDSAARASRGEQPYYPLWLAHALGDAFRTLIPPLAFLCLPSTWSDLLCCNREHEDDDEGHEGFTVPPEDNDIKECIRIKAKAVSYKSIKRL